MTEPTKSHDLSTAHACFAALNLAPASDAFCQDWAASADLPLLFEEAYIQEQAAFLGLSDAVLAACLDQAQELATRKAHCRLLQHMVYSFQKQKPKSALYVFPVAAAEHRSEQTDAAVPPLINVLLCLQLVDAIRQRYRALGIDEAVCRETLADLAIWIDDYQQKTGAFGFAQMDWLKNHFTLSLFKLGRLQFEHVHLKDEISVYRHRQSGEVLISCHAGQRLCEDGLFGSSNSCGIYLPDTCVEHETTADGHFLRATVFDTETGLAVAEPQRFCVDDYELVLEKGATVLSVHIAADGPMTREACLASFAEAMPFYHKHFPDLKPLAFYCSSWLLNPHFKTYLKPSSNIVQFLALWQLFAQPHTKDDAFFMRVWAQPKEQIDIETAEQKSSLQRAVVAHVKAGGRWNDMGGLILPEQLPHA